MDHTLGAILLPREESINNTGPVARSAVPPPFATSPTDRISQQHEVNSETRRSREKTKHAQESMPRRTGFGARFAIA
jgi:hypothetical protein